MESILLKNVFETPTVYATATAREPSSFYETNIFVRFLSRNSVNFLSHQIDNATINFTFL